MQIFKNNANYSDDGLKIEIVSPAPITAKETGNIAKLRDGTFIFVYSD